MNEKNAILINTKDPMYYQQTYERTLQKNFEKFQDEKEAHKQEQIQAVQKIDDDINKSVIASKLEQAIEDIEKHDDVAEEDNFKSIADLRKEPLPFDLEKDFPDLLHLDDPKPLPI